MLPVSTTFPAGMELSCSGTEDGFPLPLRLDERRIGFWQICFDVRNLLSLTVIHGNPIGTEPSWTCSERSTLCRLVLSESDAGP